MNPLLSPKSPSFLLLNQLTPHCNRLQNSLHDERVTNKERILYEQTLWSEVKKIRALNESSIYVYLVGYYQTILQQASRLTHKSDLFQYHVLIRLGDLNRYMDISDVAEYYYCNARNLFPQFGHAYNQLGLLTEPTYCYKLCYYYARAAKSSEKPLNTIADSNLRIAVSKYNCALLSHILDDESSISPSSQTIESIQLPTTAFEWFYVIIVGIYADNIQPLTKSFLSYLSDNFSTHKAANIKNSVKTTTIYCDRESYILLASLDVLMDWLCLGSQGKNICALLSNELRQMRSRLRNIIASSKSDITQSSNNSSNAESTITVLEVSRGVSPSFSSQNSTQNDSSLQANTSPCIKSVTNFGKTPALPHDYVLRGFSPLDSIHSGLLFNPNFKAGGHFDQDSDSSTASFKNFIDAPQLLQIASRIVDKMETFGPIMRKQTRNIALESILSHLDGNND